MVAPVIIAALISAAVAVGTETQASKREKRASRAQKRISASQAALERRQEVRDIRIQRARVEAQAQAGGVGSSSGADSALNSIVSQTGVNQSARTITQSLSNEAGEALQSAADIRGVGGVTAQFVGTAGGTLFGG